MNGADDLTADDAGVVAIPEATDAVMMALPPLAITIVDAAIDNMIRKLIAGYRNKAVAKPNAKETDWGAETKETSKATSAQSVMDVANRGQAWEELIRKSLTAGISSIATIQFDGSFTIKDGVPDKDFKDLPETPGVYVVFNQDSPPKAVYVGDSGNMKQRWHAGHLNEHKQGEQSGAPYKLAQEFADGCTVQFIKMDSVESAAALEAHLIKENFAEFADVAKNPRSLSEEEARIREQALDNGMLKNKREELATEQGKRSNIEAKKLKDSMESATTLFMGAAGEALKHAGFDVLHRVTTTSIKAVRDELVDVLHPQGAPTKIIVRIRRVLRKIVDLIKGFFDKPLQLARGIVQFIVNALSKSIGQIYNLANNIFDLANNAWNLYRGAESMTREELVRKISETVIVSGSLVLWDGLDPIIEAKLMPFAGLFAPYLSSMIVAIGFGLSAFQLQRIVNLAVDGVVAFKTGLHESLETARSACTSLVGNAQRELAWMADLQGYLESSRELSAQLQAGTLALSGHRAIRDSTHLPCALPSGLPLMGTLHPDESSRTESPGPLVATSGEIDAQDERAIAEFACDLDEAIKNLEEATKQRDQTSQKIQEVQRALGDRSWWGAITANLSGKTDKELATMVLDLSASLGLTQSALSLILKVQTEKNRLLKGFNHALVDKITKVQADAQTLDSNQRHAALNFLQDLRSHIETQLRQQELVKSHEVKIREMAAWRIAQEQAHGRLIDQLCHMQAAIVKAEGQLVPLEAAVSEVHTLRRQISHLEEENRRLSSLKMVIRRNLVPLLVTVAGWIALFWSLKG